MPLNIISPSVTHNSYNYLSNKLFNEKLTSLREQMNGQRPKQKITRKKLRPKYAEGGSEDGDNG
jgi:hypothetical protein